jgi:hypothetical protein
VWLQNQLQLADFQSNQYLLTAIENWQSTHQMFHYFTAIEGIFVSLQISKLEVAAILTQHNQHNDYVTIQSELKNLSLQSNIEGV